MILFKVGGYKNLIEEVECTRANKKSVWYIGKWRKGKEERSARHTNYSSYFDTIEEAKVFLDEKFQREIKAAEDRLSKAKANLKELNKY